MTGEVVVVPVANPIGLAQQAQGYLRGRYEANSAGNFNRGYADLAESGRRRRSPGRLGGGRGGQRRGGPGGDGRGARRPSSRRARSRCCGTRCSGLAYDADLVLDLHADNEAVLHLYLGTPLWPDAADLAAELGARAVLLAEVSGGNPFDEACGGPWWALAAALPGGGDPAGVPCGDGGAALEQRVDAGLAEDDARALLRFLTRRGVVAGAAGAPAGAALRRRRRSRRCSR